MRGPSACREKLAGCGRDRVQRIERIASARAHPVADDAVRSERRLQTTREIFVGRVQIGDALQSVRVRFRQSRRRPGPYARIPAQHQRHVLRERQRNPVRRAALRFGQQRQRPIQPAIVRGLRSARAVFEQILAVEMRALAIRRRDCVKNDQLLRLEALVQLRERRMQREHSVQLELRRRDRERTALRGVRAIAVRRYGGETIERTTQQDEHESRVGGDVGEHAARQHCSCACGQCSTHECASARHVRSHLRWNSGLASNSVRPCSALAARVIAMRVRSLSAAPSDRSPRLSGCSRPAARAATDPAHSMRFSNASGPSQCVAVSGHPAGEPGV